MVIFKLFATKTKFSGKKINFVTDKGYIMKDVDKKKLLNKKIKMITPYKKNQKNKKTKKRKINSNREKRKLKNRYKIEHVNQTIKKYDRLRLRKDRQICTFKSFLFLGISLNLLKIKL